MDDYECLYPDRRKFFKEYLSARTPEQRRRFLTAMYHDIDPKSGEFTKRHFFQFPPQMYGDDALREHDGPRRRDRPAMSEESYTFYTDGVRSDSDEGRARSKRNGARIREIRIAIANRKPGEVVEVKAWDYVNGREVDEVVAETESADPGAPDFDWESDTEAVPF